MSGLTALTRAITADTTTKSQVTEKDKEDILCRMQLARAGEKGFAEEARLARAQSSV